MAESSSVLFCAWRWIEMVCFVVKTLPCEIVTQSREIAPEQCLGHIRYDLLGGQRTMSKLLVVTTDADMIPDIAINHMGVSILIGFSVALRIYSQKEAITPL